MKPSQQWQHDEDHLLAFREAFIALINASELTGDWMDHQYIPKGDRKEWSRLRSEVAIAAGVATHAYLRAGGGTYTLKNAAYIMNNVNPVSNWEMALKDPEQMPPETVIGSIETALGVASTEKDLAKSRERGLIGLIAAFLRWPQDLREAVGPNRGQRRAASAIGVFGQIAVATIGGALAVGVAAGAVALWQLVFK